MRVSQKRFMGPITLFDLDDFSNYRISNCISYAICLWGSFGLEDNLNDMVKRSKHECLIIFTKSNPNFELFSNYISSKYSIE